MSLPGGERPWERGWSLKATSFPGSLFFPGRRETLGTRLASRLDHGDTQTWKVIELSFRLLFERGKLVSCRKLSILRNTIWWNDNGNYSWWILHGNDFFISCYYLRVRRESEDFIGFLCNSWFSLIQIIIFTFRRIKRTQWMPFLLTKRTSQLACHAAFS